MMAYHDQNHFWGAMTELDFYWYNKQKKSQQSIGSYQLKNEQFQHRYH